MSVARDSIAGGLEELTVENVRLRKAMRDMVALATLPALWIGQGPEGIARSLASALLATLSLDLAYVRIGQCGSREHAQVLRSRSALDSEHSRSVLAAIESLLAESESTACMELADPAGQGVLRLAVTRFGIHDRGGVLVTASRHADFPTDIDRALLGVGANQTGIVLQRLHAERQSEESGENLDAALQAADLGHWRMDLTDGCIQRNVRHDRIFGHDSLVPEWDYPTLLQHIAPEHREKLDAARSQAIATNTAWEMECRLAGDSRWVWIKGKVLHDTDGRPAVLTGVIADITQRMITERELRDARGRLQAALTAGAILTWTWDIPSNRMWADESLALMFGLDAQAAAGGDLNLYADGIHPDDRERVTSILQRAVRSDGDYAADYRVVLGHGPVRWVAARGQVERDAEGRPLRMPGVLVDITQRKALENELGIRIAELAAMDRRKDEFLATLAHELRNPLAPIRNALQILKMPRIDATVTNRVREVMERQVNQLVRLVDDLLDMSRVMRGKIDLRIETVELSSVVARAVETAQPLIDTHGHTLQIDLPPESLLIDVDPVRLSQVISNLLTNAAKYTEDGGTIRVSAEVVEGQVVLRIRDNGIGIPADMLAHVFELFVQVEQANDKSQGGLGIGLTLVRNLVEMHQGSVSVHSDGPGQGTEFTVRLPLSSQQAERALSGAAPELVGRPGQRVLIVDDNADAAESLTLLLQLKGFEVKTVHDGESALSVGREFAPHLVLLDLGMPGMDGHEVARRMRADPLLRTSVLAALTGWGQQEDRIRTAQSGFDLHLVKPVDATDLDRLLASLGSGGSHVT